MVPGSWVLPETLTSLNWKTVLSKITWAHCYPEIVSSILVWWTISSSHNDFHTSFLLSLSNQSHPLSFILDRWPHFPFDQENWDPMKQGPSIFLSLTVSIKLHWVFAILFLFSLLSEGEKIIPLLFAKVHSLYSLLISLCEISLGNFPALFAFLPHTTSLLLIYFPVPHTLIPSP